MSLEQAIQENTEAIKALTVMLQRSLIGEDIEPEATIKAAAEPPKGEAPAAATDKVSPDRATKAEGVSKKTEEEEIMAVTYADVKTAFLGLVKTNEAGAKKVLAHFKVTTLKGYEEKGTPEDYAAIIAAVRKVEAGEEL